MALVDQYGRALCYGGRNNKAARSAERYSRDRPCEPVELKDIGTMIPAIDRKTLLSGSRRLYINKGEIRGALDQKAMYTVGRAWAPEFKGDDLDFGVEAEAFLQDEFYPVGDVRGGMHDFVTNLAIWSIAIDRDGEIFILLTETENGFPKYQTIESHRIATPNGVRDGKVKGESGNLIDGIIYHKSGAPKRYAFIDEKGDLIEWIEAANIIHLYDPSWAMQGRGISGLTHCINDMRDCLQAHEWERLAMMTLSSIGIIEYNENGGPDVENPSILLNSDGSNTDTGLTMEKLDGGSVRYFKSNSGSKIETIKNDRPGNAFLEFHDRMIHSAFYGMNWSYAFWKGASSGGGTAQRTEIATAQRAVEDRQDLLAYAARRLVGYAVAKGQKIKRVPKSPEWFKWGFSHPSKLTIDDGRTAKELESAFKLGFRNKTGIQKMMGGNPAFLRRERAQEVYLDKKAAQEWSKDGITVEYRDMILTTPNETSETQETTQTNGTSTD